MHWVNKSTNEVSGLGKLIIEGGNIRVIEAILLPQKNTAVTTDIEAVDIGKAAFLMKDTPGDLRFWWHSHVNMAVFWSATDVATMKLLAQGGWFLSTVFNKKQETRSCLTMNDPFPLVFDNMEFVIQRVLPTDLVASWDKDYEEKVTNLIPKRIPHTKAVQSYQSMGRPLTQQEQAQIMAQAQANFNKANQPKKAPPLLSPLEAWEEEESAFPVLSDLDWPGLVESKPSSKLLDTPDRTPAQVLAKRTELENKIEKLEAQMEALAFKNRVIPDKMIERFAKLEDELSDIEQELDVLESYGIITEADRFGEDNLIT